MSTDQPRFFFRTINVFCKSTILSGPTLLPTSLTTFAYFFHLSQQYFLISHVMSSLPLWMFKMLLFYVHIFIYFSNVFLLLSFNFISLHGMLCFIWFQSFYIFYDSFHCLTWSILQNFLCTLEYNMCSAHVEWHLELCVRSSQFLVLLKSSIS